MSSTKKFTNIKVEKLPESEAQITGEITLEFLNECRPEAISHLGKHASIPGFRPGRIPEDVLVKKLGEVRILEEVAEVAIAREYANIIDEAKVKAIGRPMISITKLVPDSPLSFKMAVSLEPEFDLPDYKKIASAVNAEKTEVSVTDKEVEEVAKELNERGIKADLKEGETLEGKVKENMQKEKEFAVREKKRLKILEQLVKETEIKVPKILVESELSKMLEQFKRDVTRAGLKWDEYLKQVKKSESEIKEEWREKAVDRVKAELIIDAIAVKEKIEPVQSEVEHESEHMMQHYTDADPLRVRIYVFSQLRNQKVFEFLENLK